MVKTSIQGGWIVGWTTNGHQILDGGTVVFENDRIVFVGFPSDQECPKAERTINARGMIVSPGLINLHCIANLDLQVLRMDMKVGEGSGYSKPRSWVMNADAPHILSDEDFRVSSRFSVATLLKGGCTAFAAVTTGATKRWEDPSVEPYALADASEEMGARAWISHLYREACDYTNLDGKRGEIWDRQKGQAGLDNAIKLIKNLQAKGNPLITGFLFPSRTDKCSDALLKETIHQSKVLGDVHVRSHFSEHLQEFRNFRAKEPHRTMVEWLSDVGFLGPQVCLTHAIYIGGHSATGESPRDDLQILAQSRTSICHCPVVFARGGSALETFSRYVNAGINMGIGSDTFPPDLLEEMRFGSLINKVIDRQRSVGSVRDFYNAATIGGARALGREDLGKLVSGATADVSIFNLSGLSSGPVDDPIRSLVHFAGRRECQTVIVGGEIVVDEGQIPGVDEERLSRQAGRSWKRYKKGLVDWDYAGRTTDIVFPTAFPIIGKK